MTKIEFIDSMKKARKDYYTGEWAGDFLCFTLDNYFKKPSLKMILEDIFDHRDNPYTGIFGRSCLESNKETRRTALELFEQVVIDEKLYKNLIKEIV